MNISSFKVLNQILLFLTCCSVSSCTILDLVDSSSDPKYSKLVGMEIVTLRNLWALGITNDQNYQGKADYIWLSESNVSGPEVVTKILLQKGMILRIKKILTTRSMLFCKVYFVVEEVGSNFLNSNNIRILLVNTVENSNFGLDSNFYVIKGVGKN